MSSRFRSFVCRVAICALLPTTATVPAQVPTQIGPISHSDAVWIGVAVAAIGAGIGIGVYYAFHHGHSLNGCAVTGSDGLQLQNRGDGQTYSLSGEIAAIKPGERVRVKGKKVKNSSGATQHFVVENLSKDYGACSVQAAH
jgi:hypothetical protein